MEVTAGTWTKSWATSCAKKGCSMHMRTTSACAARCLRIPGGVVSHRLVQQTCPRVGMHSLQSQHPMHAHALPRGPAAPRAPCWHAPCNIHRNLVYAIYIRMHTFRAPAEPPAPCTPYKPRCGPASQPSSRRRHSTAPRGSPISARPWVVAARRAQPRCSWGWRSAACPARGILHAPAPARALVSRPLLGRLLGGCSQGGQPSGANCAWSCTRGRNRSAAAMAGSMRVGVLFAVRCNWAHSANWQRLQRSQAQQQLGIKMQPAFRVLSHLALRPRQVCAQNVANQRVDSASGQQRKHRAHCRGMPRAAAQAPQSKRIHAAQRGGNLTPRRALDAGQRCASKMRYARSAPRPYMPPQCTTVNRVLS